MLLNAQNLSIAALAMKDKMSRVPSGVKVSRNGTETTNGHLAIRVSAPKGEAHQEKNFPTIEGIAPEPAPDFILPVDAAKKIQAAIPKRTTIPVLHHAMVGQTSRGTITIATTDLETPQTFAPRLMDAQKWPNMDAVWPKDGTETGQIQMGAEAMISLLQQIVAFDGVKVPSTGQAVLTLKLYGPNNAMRLQAVNRETGQELDAILMPVNMPEALPKGKPAPASKDAKAWALTAKDSERIHCTNACGKKASVGYSPNGGAPFWYYCASCTPVEALKLLPGYSHAGVITPASPAATPANPVPELTDQDIPE